jgi:phosphoadenosine phosphosulfate reductase
LKISRLQETAQICLPDTEKSLNNTQTNTMSSPELERTTSQDDIESGYASASSDNGGLTDVYFTKPHLKFLNKQLNQLEPEGVYPFITPRCAEHVLIYIDILKWCITSLPNLYQTTAFGFTGLVTLDMLSKLDLSIKPKVDLIFLDTLYHFQETLSLVDRVRERYPNTKLHVYKPEGVDSTEEFEAKHGPQLWETNDEYYDWVAKVEPAQRANNELGVRALLTGRRRSQGGKRGDLDIVEVDDEGIIKINPLANWSFKQVKDYIDQHNVPYNELLDRGYKSVGDWHSTQPVKAGEDERAGRWAGQTKTECGIHNKKSRYAQFLMEQEAKRQQEELNQALAAVNIKA